MKTNEFLRFGLKNTSIILFVALFMIFGILTPRFFTYQNFENILAQASYIGIIAVGMTFVLLTGGIDLSVGSNMYVSGIIAGLLIGRNVPIWLALLACLVVGFLMGSLNAFFITKLKIVPFVVTLGLMVAGRGLGLYMTRSQAVYFPEQVTMMSTVKVAGIIPLPIAIFALVVFAAYIFLNWTQLGRQIYAAGNDIEAAKKAGIHTQPVIATVYIVCGLCAALGGFVSVAQLGIINAGFGQGDEFDAIASAVLGGTSLFGGIGSVFPGTVLGTVMIQMVQAGLVFSQIDLYIQPLIMAAIIFLAVFLDSMRIIQLKKMERRTIMKQE
jgi:ribose transport system permease protein